MSFTRSSGQVGLWVGRRSRGSDGRRSSWHSVSVPSREKALGVHELRDRARSATIPQTPRLAFREMSVSDLVDMAALLGDRKLLADALQRTRQ